MILKPLILFLIVISSVLFAADNAEPTFQDFLNYKKIQTRNDMSRGEDLKEFNHERQIYQRQLEKDRLHYIKNRKSSKIIYPESTPDYKFYLKEKSKKNRDYEELRSEYARNKKMIRKKTDKQDLIELGLDDHKEKYAYKERQLYGGGKKYSINSSGGGSGNSGAGGSYSGGGGGGYRPSAPDFDTEEFEDDEDIPPPPPPPPSMDSPMGNPYGGAIPPADFDPEF